MKRYVRIFKSGAGYAPQVGGIPTEWVDVDALIDGRIPAEAGLGDVVGPASATDNAFARYNGTTGKAIQAGKLTEDDDGFLTTVFSKSISAAGFGNDYGMYLVPTVTNSVNSSRGIYGISTNPTLAGTTNYDSIYGVDTAPVFNSTGSLGTGIYGMSSAPRNQSGSGMPHIYAYYSGPVSNAGNITKMYGLYSTPTIGGGTVAGNYGVYIEDPFAFSGGAVTNNYAVWIAHQVTGTNDYAFWYDSPGVYRINGDGIMAYYNPTFAKYVPAATNYERIVQQWVSNIAQFGTEASGTGTLRKLRLIGAGLILSTDILPTSNPAIAGQLWNDAGTLKVSAG